MKLEKYVDKNSKRRKTILITISVIVLIGVSFLLFKTFASFTESAEFPMMKGKVDYFGNSDIYFVFYKNDELIDEMPQKNNSEKLVFDHGNCDNNAEIIWNASEWAPLVKGLNKVKTKCELYFAVTPLPTNIVASDITMIKSSDSWTKEDVEVTLKQNKYQGFILQYRTNKNTDWQDYKSPFKVSENNTIVYVKLKDTAGNESKEYQVGVVNNIDKVAPTNVSYKPIYTIPSYGGEIGFIGYHMINGTDESNETSGASGELKYYFTNDKGQTWYPENGLSEEEVKRINEDKNGYYPLANNAGNTYGMKVVDKAGNETITDYTDFTPYDPGFPYIQFINPDAYAEEHATFQLFFEGASFENLEADNEIQFYVYDIAYDNGEENYEYLLSEYEEAINDYKIENPDFEYPDFNIFNIDNITDFKKLYEEGKKIANDLSEFFTYEEIEINQAQVYLSDGQNDVGFYGFGPGIYLLMQRPCNNKYCPNVNMEPVIFVCYEGKNRNLDNKIYLEFSKNNEKKYVQGESRFYKYDH